MAQKAAEEFKTNKAYYIGDLTLYGGILYKFKANHSAGAWIGTDTDPVDSNMEQRLGYILTVADYARKSIAYTETVKMNPELIKETRYKYIFTNEPDPRG